MKTVNEKTEYIFHTRFLHGNMLVYKSEDCEKSNFSKLGVKLSPNLIHNDIYLVDNIERHLCSFI